MAASRWSGPMATPSAITNLGSVMPMKLSIVQMRFGMFHRGRRTIGIVTATRQQMLTRTLRRLECDGVVTRTVHPTVRPMVEYALNPIGHSLAGLGQDLGRWMVGREQAIYESQAAFDAREAQE